MLTRDQRDKLKADLRLYALNFLYITPKQGKTEKFHFNKAQLYIHKKLEEQKKRTGKVRALILKGRQQGCSTYVAARFYHQVTHREGCNVFILTHREDATKTLYGKVKLFQDKIDNDLKPSIRVSNSKELIFDSLNSGYLLGTAGSGEVGRSATVQLLHLSEAAFYENSGKISGGLMQTVPDMKDTEIIVESTAKLNGFFENLCRTALKGEGQYQLIFVPWFWQEEYRTPPPTNFKATEEEETLRKQFKLKDDQLYWRRNKITELDEGIWQFKREYPNDVVEAFEPNSEDSYIPSFTVMQARKYDISNRDYQLIVGIDIARTGRTAISFRQGRTHVKTLIYRNRKTTETIGVISNLIENYKPYLVNIDAGSFGIAIYDRLIELGYKNVIAVNFGGKADNSQRYFNKRAEMFGRTKEWFEEGLVKIEDDAELHKELIEPKFTFDSNGRLKIESKEEVIKRLKISPDKADAFILTFAYLIPNLTQDYREQEDNDKLFFDDSRNETTGY